MKPAAFLLILLSHLPLSASTSKWQLIWSDEFDYTGLPNPAKWDYEKGFIRNDEAQLYMAERLKNTQVENGLLIIEAHKEKLRNPFHDPNSYRNKKETGDYTSGSLTTFGKHSWTYGRFEFRAKVPKGIGTWPAIFTFGNNKKEVRWPHCGEIDILEYVGFKPGIIHANVYSTSFNHLNGTSRGNVTTVPDADTVFHTYVLEWTPQGMAFFVDDMKFFSCFNDGTGEDSWPFDKPHYLIMNLAIGGAWGGTQGIDDAALPARFEIDYVRIYQEKK
ncbi:MAG: glycoside hydrolase family 16 protein [Gloeobacteraceae cyanobacterium ES-bin-144]|nr:glycoside hydrolase family 16 protein [Verrucomicrobiales bacterium]